VSPPGRPKGEHRSAQREGTRMSAKGRPECELRPRGGSEAATAASVGVHQ
jgi:hypothetical protein